jgi:hypothetical protein
MVASTPSEAQVAIGSIVSIEHVDSGARGRYPVVNSYAGSRDAILALSPVGRSLLGRRAGALVWVGLSDGRSLGIRVIAVHERVEVPGGAPGTGAGGPRTPRQGFWSAGRRLLAFVSSS